MSPETKPAVILLAVCAASDLLAVPPLLGDEPFIAVLTGVLGILTIVAAVGLARGASWAKPLALGSRALDILTAVPGFAAEMPAPVIVSVVIVLSLVTIAAVVKARTATASPAY